MMSAITHFPRVAITDRSELDPRAGFAGSTDFYLAVMNAGRGRVDQRLLKLRAAAGSDEHGAYSDPHGGFLLPKALAPNVLGISTDDPTASLTTPIEMTSSIVRVTYLNDKDHTTSVSGGLVMYRRPETTVVNTSRMQLEQLTLHSPELVGLTFATNELITDSAPSVPTVLQRQYTSERNGTVFLEKIIGSGVAEYQGVVKSGCLITVDAEAGQAAGTVLAQNVEKMEARVWRYASAIWLAHVDLKAQLKTLVRTIGTAGQVMPYFTYRADGQELLSGRPIYFTDRCSAPGSVGDIICGVWSEYLEGLYMPLQFASSIHVRYLANETAFRFIERGDGASWWRVPLTQRNSSITVSPFVTLAARGE